MPGPKVSLREAPPKRRVVKNNATVTTDGYDMKSASQVDDAQMYGAWGYYVYCNKACSVYAYCVGEASAMQTAGAATNFMTRVSYCLAANTFGSHKFTAGPRFWYVKVVPASTANNAHIGTYRVNV